MKSLKLILSFWNGDVENTLTAPTTDQNLDATMGMTVKYMLMMFGDGSTMMETHDDQWVRDMIAFMGSFNQELNASGEWVFAEGLADPTTAKTLTLTDGQVVVTDGPFAEAKESLAGFWIWDVKDEARAIELATKILPWAQRVELREVPAGPPEV
jgi:hypothetical protein